ncbi:hypothetical protein VMCG_08395 [Cytospora schulzeri]|uniref:Uncharacterized protein n=1 Tax=Cytospora schulzeri TaxID=448051 RepID=A0A423VQW3_9PEZI|nr:hypothetical protein VMCG_08395 [Valsa malicola]
MTRNLNLQVCGANLFLLEKWDPSSSLSDDDQLVQVFSSFIQLPFTQRYVYTKRIKDQGLRKFTDLPQADQDLLSRLRKPEELQCVDTIWLRTCYDDGSDAAFSAFMKEHGPSESDYPVFEDACRYNYGGGDGWRRIFTRLPQFLSPHDMSPEEYEAEKQKALEECFEDEQQDIEEVKEQGGVQEEDGTYWGQLYSLWHYTTQVGMIFVIDEKTLRVAAEDPRSAKVLAVWFDEMGRVVRQKRMSEHETWCVEGLKTGLGEGAFMESGMWVTAKPGEDYDWEGPLGPPALIGEEFDS